MHRASTAWSAARSPCILHTGRRCSCLQHPSTSPIRMCMYRYRPCHWSMPRGLSTSPHLDKSCTAGLWWQDPQPQLSQPHSTTAMPRQSPQCSRCRQSCHWHPGRHSLCRRGSDPRNLHSSSRHRVHSKPHPRPGAPGKAGGTEAPNSPRSSRRSRRPSRPS